MATASVAVPVLRPATATADADADGWDLGPFVKHQEPVLRPTPDSRFTCPIRGQEVRWEEQNVYNPAVVVRDGKVYLLYRADDRSPDLGWGRTCRIGLAWSEDGVHFTRHSTPVLYPDNDAWKPYEWEGGCEDLHIVEGEDGVYTMNYTTWSENLIDWTPAGKAVWPGGGREAGAIALLRHDGILLMTQGGHPTLGAWVLRQTLIDRQDLTTVLKEQPEPFLYPEHDWEKNGFTGHTTVANGLVRFQGRWLLYYGAADRVIGLTIGSRP